MPGMAFVYQISGSIHGIQDFAEIFPFQMNIGRHLAVYQFIHLFFLFQKQINISKHLGGKAQIPDTEILWMKKAVTVHIIGAYKKQVSFFHRLHGIIDQMIGRTLWNNKKFIMIMGM